MSKEYVDNDEMLDLLLCLLDRIEIEEDHTLASQRFEIARQCGYEVVFGEQISGLMN